MALSPEERQLGAALKKSGKTNTEIARIIASRRAGSTTPEQPQEEPSPSYSQGVSQAYQSGISKIEQGREAAQQGDSLVETIPGATKAAAGTIEALSAPVAPLFAPVANAFKSATDYLSETPFFKGYGEDTANLPADETNTGEQILDFTADLGVVAGTATGPKGVTAVASKAKSALSAAREALAPLPEGSAGIQAAREAGTLPESLMQRVARIPKAKQAEFEQIAGVPVGRYLIQRDIFGTPDKIVEQLYNRFQQSKGEADKALATLKGNYKNSAVGGMLKELGDRERSISSVGAPSRDLERVIALDKKMKGEGLSMSEVNEVKRLYERNVKLEFMKDPSKLGQNVARANNLDSAVREWQMSMARQLGLKNLDEINKETRLARQLADDLGAEYSGSAGNNAIGITDWIALSGGSVANLGMFLTKQALTSKTVMSKAAELMAGSTPKVAAPKAEISAPTIDNYMKFLERTDPKAQGGGPNNAMNTVNVANTTAPGQAQVWPTTASKPSKAGVTSTGSARIGKEGVSAQKADTSVPFEGAETTLDRFRKEGLPLRAYRGTLSGEIGSIPKEGLSVSFDNSVAAKYAKARGQGGFTDKVELAPDAKVIKLDQVPNEIRAAEEGSDFAGKAAIWARKNGYDILDMSAGNEAELRILTSKAIKGASPSIPKELEPLAAEARKYKSAEEFIKMTAYSPARDSAARGTLRKAVAALQEDNPLASLKPNAENPKLDTSTVRIKAEDIREGARPFVLVDGDKVIDGHHALEAYKSLGFENIPTIQKSDLTDFYNKATGGTPKGAKP